MRMSGEPGLSFQSRDANLGIEAVKKRRDERSLIGADLQLDITPEWGENTSKQEVMPVFPLLDPLLNKGLHFLTASDR